VFITALYTFRMLFMAFHGKERAISCHERAPRARDRGRHESPWVVTVPLVLLAIPSVFIAGWVIGPMLVTATTSATPSWSPTHDGRWRSSAEYHGVWA
jgi:NADH-quinone oxidoreductase subunit L